MFKTIILFSKETALVNICLSGADWIKAHFCLAMPLHTVITIAYAI